MLGGRWIAARRSARWAVFRIDSGTVTPIAWAEAVFTHMVTLPAGSGAMSFAEVPVRIFTSMAAVCLPCS